MNKKNKKKMSKTKRCIFEELPYELYRYIIEFIDNSKDFFNFISLCKDTYDLTKTIWFSRPIIHIQFLLQTLKFPKWDKQNIMKKIKDNIPDV